VREDAEEAGVSTDERRRASVESLESFERLETRRRRRELEEQRVQQEEEERRKRAAEEEELRLRELEEEERCHKQREEEERRLRQERRSREEEEIRIREEEERRQREEEERRIREEEERRRLEEQRRKRQQREEEEEARRQRELEAERKRKLREEEEERKKKEEAEKLRLQETEEKKHKEAEERMRKEQEEQRRAEELRWREMEERQTPFSFKVSSSGEKQILFQKVHLTPVTPAASGHQGGGGASEQRESAKASCSEGPESPNLPASPYVPHTAILVTGAQLCGTSVNLNQIKDTACMSLLGLGDGRKAQGTPPTKSKTSPDRKSGKTKSLNESSLSPDQSVLAEWASIRSKIFKGVEDGKYDEHQDPSKNQPDGSHTNLRKTMSASAKFSITPAKKKFGDSNRNSEVFGADEKDAVAEAAAPSAAPSADPSAAPSAATTPVPVPTGKPQNKSSKTVRIAERGSEECVFAKDLPSFLVPSPGAKSEAPESPEGREEPDGEDQLSTFGIKLRRTNFSLRFHSEQSAEKRKKRYSAGDSFDGVPSPLTPIEPDSDGSSVFSDKSTSPTSPQREVAAGKYLHATAGAAAPRAKPGKSTEGDKVLSKPPIYRRPTASPTPPPSPPAVAQSHRSDRQGHAPVEEEPKEKRSFFPSINIPWREKADRKSELIKKGAFDSFSSNEERSGSFVLKTDRIMTRGSERCEGFRALKVFVGES